ncbi:DUF2934 domain-containing protein [Rhizobium calliandrae]|uniref:DUF2934 domain-containing protein n=1 Tax=Rhizobium calliandrae TaxID=1312182 RepID=A0ABT7KC79_9HYPH|nr:DUF2934 domain-containing protein [Rhizobium calliandrae]MDL2406228.1 DUF2934 domain-containing protein [Rhizobium calliandrae]
MAANKQEEIRLRAYAIWESEGRPEGADARHWQQACDELNGDTGHRMTQRPLDEIDRDEAALLQGAGENGDLDQDSGTSHPAKKKLRHKRSAKSATRKLEITAAEKSPRQKIKKTQGA